MELSARVKMEVWSIRNVRRGTTSSLNMKIRLKSFRIRISLMRVEKRLSGQLICMKSGEVRGW